MSKMRFTPWIVLACIGTLAGCTSGEGGTAGNTEMNVIVPNNAGQSSAPDAFDIQVVEYTIACNDGIDNGPFLDNGASFDDDVTISGVLEVLDTASSGVTTQDFGPDLTDVYVWQGFMDLPPTAGCTVQLRARDADGEVICTATEVFDIAADSTTKVNVLMYCGISFQAPVGMLDLDGDFSFNVANFCPDLFVLNCIDSELNVRTIPGVGEVLATACQVRFRDGDSQCGDSCDPQTCVPTPEGLSCTPGPDPGQPTTVVTCASTLGACAISCDGFNPAASCTFTGDTLGVIGSGPPGPLAPGDGGFFVSCATIDDDGDPLTPQVPLTPGDDIVCTAVTTDGDVDCDKTKTADLTIEGLTACQAFGGDAACDAASASVCQVGTCVDGTCDGTAANCCTYAPGNEGGDCSSEIPDPIGVCESGVCVSDSCGSDAECDNDGNDCTFAPAGTCDLGSGVCGPLSNSPGGTACDAGGGAGSGACDGAGTCIDNCLGVVCDDGNECTDDPACVSVGGPTCPPPVNDDTNTCTTCLTGTCVCSGGLCEDGCTVPAVQNAPGIPMACRNSFNQVVSTFPIDLLNVSTGGQCVLAGQPLTIDYDPTIALDTAFLQAAADTLCDLGTPLTQADVTVAQVSVDEVLGGLTCTEQLSVLPGTPVTVILDVTVTGTCGAGGTVAVNSGVSLPLPPATLSCTAGALGASAAVCSTGTVPLNITLANPAVQSFVGVSVSGGAIQVVFQCNTSSTTAPAPGVTVSCTSPNPTGECAALPPGNVGETPFPVSDCDFSDGFPGACETVPVGVDPLTVCPTFVVQ